MITEITRAEANDRVSKVRRYNQIIECLQDNPEMTAKELAVTLHKKGYIPTTERNFTAPRLTELAHAGTVEVIGKTKCRYTGKTVAVYALTDFWEES